MDTNQFWTRPASLFVLIIGRLGIQSNSNFKSIKMKEIKAFIKPKRVKIVVESLRDAGFESLTLSKGEGTGAFRQKNASPSLDFHFTDSPIVKLELVCQNEEAQKAIHIIVEKGKTPDPSDGIIYLSDVEDAFRIKTGESIKTLLP